MSVEFLDVYIPQELQEEMSLSAQAKSEKTGCGQAEMQPAIIEAAEVYASSPRALRLRDLTIIYEALKKQQNILAIKPNDIARSLDVRSLAVVKGLPCGNRKAERVPLKILRPVFLAECRR